MLFTVSACNGCSKSFDQTFSSDYKQHPVSELPVSEFATAKSILQRELAEPAHYVSLDIDLIWVTAHKEAEVALLRAGYVEVVHGKLRYARKARSESGSCGIYSDGVYHCRFAVARAIIAGYVSFARIPTSIIGYEGTNFVVTIRAVPISPIGETLLRSGALTCLPPVSPDGNDSHYVSWANARQLAFGSIDMPAPLRADKESKLTVSSCPTLED